MTQPLDRSQVTRPLLCDGSARRSERAADAEPVAGVDQRQAEQLGDVQNLDVPETGERTTDAGQQRPDGDENVAHEPVMRLLPARKANRRVDRTTDEEDQGVSVDERGKCAHPRPREHLPESRCVSASAGLTGLASTQADATSTTVTRHAVSTFAVLRRSRRYTVPAPAARRPGARRRCTTPGRSPRASRPHW